MSQYYIDDEDEYPLAKYEGVPEFDLFNSEFYVVNEESELPSISLSTNTHPEELPPLPSEHTMDYQKFHPELEKYAIFRALPLLM